MITMFYDSMVLIFNHFSLSSLPHSSINQSINLTLILILILILLLVLITLFMFFHPKTHYSTLNPTMIIDRNLAQPDKRHSCNPHGNNPRRTGQSLANLWNVIRDDVIQSDP